MLDRQKELLSLSTSYVEKHELLNLIMDFSKAAKQLPSLYKRAKAVLSCKATHKGNKQPFCPEHRMVINLKFSQHLEGAREIAHSKQHIHFSHN